MADATKESEVRKGLKIYLMVKAVLVQPVRGGGARQNRNVNLTEKLMSSFWKGREDEVWQTALEIEQARHKKKFRQQKSRAKKGQKVGASQSMTKMSEVKSRSDRAKELTNDGELSKAFAVMVQRGVAPPTDSIVSQLKKKFPARRKVVHWPRREKIDELRKLIEKIPIEKVLNRAGNIKELTSRGVDIESLRNLRE